MQRFAIVDTETTGFGKSDRILEIAVDKKTTALSFFTL